MSLRAELVRLGLRCFVKRRLRHQTVEDIRRQLLRIEPFIPRLPAEMDMATVYADKIKLDRIRPPASRPDCHVLYLHGGAYIAGTPVHYRHLTWRIAAATRATLWAVYYRLAPEHPFPAALDDAVAAYRWLIAEGGDPRRLVVIGDSAGGGLVFGLLLRLRDDGIPLPGTAVALSPWTDLALTGASLRLNARSDPMLDAECLPKVAQLYLADADPRTPYASPLYGDLAGLPPALIQVGGDEILLDDSVRMAERLRAARCHVELEVWPRMPHVWHLFAPALPEARQAIGNIGAFVSRHLPDAQSPLASNS